MHPSDPLHLLVPRFPDTMKQTGLFHWAFQPLHVGLGVILTWTESSKTVSQFKPLLIKVRYFIRVFELLTKIIKVFKMKSLHKSFLIWGILHSLFLVILKYVIDIFNLLFLYCTKSNSSTLYFGSFR